MDGVNAVVHHPLMPPHPPLSAKQIECKFARSRQKQNQYSFPRERQSFASSDASQSLKYSQLYNLHLQNNANHQQQGPQKNPPKSKTNQMSSTKIMKLKQIHEYSQRQSMAKREKLRIISSRNSPQSVSTCMKKVDLQSAQPTPTTANRLRTPNKSTKFEAGNEKTKSRSSKKLMVLSARNLRKIETFKFEGTPGSQKKGIRLYSREKTPAIEVRTISIF